MAEVTDPKILEQLNAQEPVGGQEVTDSALLRQLNSQEPAQPAAPPQEARLPNVRRPVTFDQSSPDPMLAAAEPIAAYGAGIQDSVAKGLGTATGSVDLELALSPGKLGQELIENNPGIATGGYVTGMVGQAALATKLAAVGIARAVAPIVAQGWASVSTGGVITETLANMITGSFFAGPGNRTFGAATGAVAQGVGSWVGATSSKAASIMTVDTKVRNTVNEFSKTIEGPAGKVAASDQANMWTTTNAAAEQLFDDFRSGAGKIEANPIIIKAAQFVSEHGDELTASQRKSITSLIDGTASAKNIADLHDLRKSMNYDYSKFTQGKPLSEPAYKAYESLQDTVSSVMENNASMVGKGAELKAANTFYKESVLPLINTGAKDTAEALSANKLTTQPMDAASIIDTQLNKYIVAKKPEEAAVWLNTLSPTGKQAVEVHAVQNALLRASSKSGGAIDTLSFKQSISEFDTAIPSLFTPKTRQLMTGLNKVIDEATTLAGMQVNPSKLGPIQKASAIGTPFIMGGYAAGGVPGAVTGVAVGYALTKMINSPWGQRALVEASRPGNAAGIQSIVNAIMLQKLLNDPRLDPVKKAMQPMERDVTSAMGMTPVPEPTLPVGQ